MFKMGVIMGFGAGYVFGARAGRQRYEQIRAKAQELTQQRRRRTTHYSDERLESYHAEHLPETPAGAATPAETQPPM